MSGDTGVFCLLLALICSLGALFGEQQSPSICIAHSLALAGRCP